MLLIGILSAITLPTAAQLNPFGVCAHLGRGDEFNELDEELALMDEAGIRWARADWSWSHFESSDNEWNFESYDTVVAASKAHGVNILPILSYNVEWAFPAHEHLDEWCDYVRTVVDRYKDDLRYWEVWNEPNIGFWKPKPNPAQYTDLLVATFETIKAIDPELQVVYGGTAGVPFAFLRATFEMGAFDAFDVLAVHPYRYPNVPETSGLVEDLEQTKALMAEFGDVKPIWITEFGWPTHITPVANDVDFLPQMIRYAAGLRFPEETAFRAAVLHEEGMPGCGALGLAVNESLGALGGVATRLVGLDELTGLNPAETRILVMPTGEHYPADHFDTLVAFVRDGGLLVHLGGVPFYYQYRLVDGEWVKEGANGRPALHAEFEAWWTVDGLPEEAGETRLAAPDDSGIAVPDKLKSTRWLTETHLQGNDRFVPLLSAYHEDELVGHPVGVYLYDSDLKGAFMATILDTQVRGVPEDTQGLYLPRALLLTLGAGVEDIFWYEFRDGGNDETYNEHRFGMIRNDLSPKPAYQAYQALTEALGEARFIESLDVGDGSYCYVFDTGESKTAAFWRASGTANVRLRVKGDAVTAVDHLGRRGEPGTEDGVMEVEASERVRYLVGLDEVSAD